MAGQFEGVLLKFFCTLQSLRYYGPICKPDQQNQKLWGRGLGTAVFKARQVIPVCGQVWEPLV